MSTLSFSQIHHLQSRKCTSVSAWITLYFTVLTHFIEHIEVFPVEIRLDYKPKRVDYKALKEGRTIELMNFFHFEGAEMTLRHITLTGVRFYLMSCTIH
jgi:hypothetical protein